MMMMMVALIVWQVLLPPWLVVLPLVFDMIDVIYVADVICQGGRWNSLPRWMWFMVRCYNHKWQMEWPQGTCFASDLVLDCYTEPHPICEADCICLCSC